jgi:hypothetical protein
MLRIVMVVLGLLISMYGIPTGASAGWIIDEVEKENDTQGQVFIQANRVKSVMLGADQKPESAFIIDLEAQTITEVNYEEQYYATGSFQEYSDIVRHLVEQGKQETAQMMQEMQESLKSMPPEQRQAMEEALRKDTEAGQECREPRFETRRTNQQATVAGHAAVRYDVLADGKLEWEYWIAKGITAWQELNPQKLERFVSIWKAMGGSCSFGPSGGALFVAEPWLQLLREGYPVRIVAVDGSYKNEVVKAENRSIPGTEFQPPASFVRKTFRETLAE